MNPTPDRQGRSSGSSRSSVRGLAAVLLAVAALGSALSAWQRSQLGAQVAALAAPGDLRMLSSRTCGICTQARAWFTEHRVAFSECLIETDRDCAILFDATRSPGTPVILVRGAPQIGFDPQRLRDALQRTAAAPARPPAPAPATTAPAAPVSPVSPRS